MVDWQTEARLARERERREQQFRDNQQRDMERQRAEQQRVAMERQQRAAAERHERLTRQIMQPPKSRDQARRTTSLDQPTTAEPFEAARPVKLRSHPLGGWDERPVLAKMTFAVIAYLSLTLIWPMLTAARVPGMAIRLMDFFGLHGQLGELAGYGIVVLVLGYASFILSIWTRPLPFTFAAGLFVVIGQAIFAR